MTVLRSCAALAAAVVLLALGAAPSAATTATIDAGHYGGPDDAGHSVTFMAAHHHLGHFQYGPHGREAHGVVAIHHGSFHDCFDHVCIAGSWQDSDTVVGVWRHHDSHHPAEHRRPHVFQAEQYR